MQRLFGVVLGVVMLSLAVASGANADVKLADGTMLPEKPYFIVSYIEVAPAAAAKAAALIRGQIAATRKEKGNMRAEGLQRVGQRNHFVILETWEDKAARETHAKAGHTINFRKALQPHLYSPYDERVHVGLVAAEPKSVRAGTRATLYVITHVDIIPPEQFAPCKRQVNESGPCGNDMVKKLVADSRKHKGMIRFDALTQANRPNHMKIVEMWTNAGTQGAHTTSTEVKHFRDSLSGMAPGGGVPADPLFLPNPLTGSLYDERLYRLIR
jgi:quinol monooxygenase YgiN